MASAFYGWQEKRGSKTGFFHLEYIDNRWWLIDPEGNVFLSLGINHVKPELLARDYNRTHSEKKYGPLPKPFSVEAFKQTKGWQVWLNTLLDDFQAWGFNTLGGLSTADARPQELPYTICLYFCTICHWTPVPQIQFPDVFSPEFENHCDELARRRCGPLVQDPQLVGYFFIDCPILTRESAGRKSGNLYWDMVRGQTPTWPDSIKSLKGYHPGKRIYVDLMRECYSDISSFNRIYNTNCESFESLYQRDMSEVKPTETARAEGDDELLLGLILERYYQVTRDAVKRHDPYHLFLGDRYNGNIGIPQVAVAAMRPYVDVLSVQYYGFFNQQKEDLTRWHRGSGKPILLCDSSFSVPDENMPNPFGPHMESQKVRAQAYEDYAQAVFSLPYVIGWHHCGYIDQWSVAQGPRQHSGIKDVWESPHKPLVQAMKRVNANVYHIATREKKI